MTKIWQKKLSNPKTEVIFEIFKKKKCEYMCYTWYENIQHWHLWNCYWWGKTWLVLDSRLVFQKISQYCPKKWKLRNWMVSTSHKWRHNATQFVLKFRGTLWKVLRIFRATFQKQTVQTDFLFWKSFYFKSFKCFRL